MLILILTMIMPITITTNDNMYTWSRGDLYTGSCMCAIIGVRVVTYVFGASVYFANTGIYREFRDVVFEDVVFDNDS